MSYAQSFYAEQKKIEKPEEQASSPLTAAFPATTPIAEDPLTPAQIQDAIRLYRSVLSSTASAPSSPVRQAAPIAPEKPIVHSDYYGGPSDIPLSYRVKYTTTQQAPASPAPDFTEQQLMAQLQALQIQQQQQPAPDVPVVEPVQQVQQKPKVAPKMLHKMYDDEESGYCFARKKDVEQEEEVPEIHVAAPVTTPIPTYSAPPVNYEAPVFNNYYSKGVSGPSEYIGMSNDCKFIYDNQRSLPTSYAQKNEYTLVNAAQTAAPVINYRPEEQEEHGVTTTEDVTQVPASPAVVSRFRGLIKNAQTPVQATAPIVVERITPVAHNTYNSNNYGAFLPVNQMSMESEYQLPVLNDLASCIEHY